MNLAQVVFTNVPWTQVVLAFCAMITLTVLLLGLRRDVDKLKNNEIPHIIFNLKKLMKALGVEWEDKI